MLLRITEWREGMVTKVAGLLVFAVVTQAADVAGHYSLTNVREMGSELLLKPDGRFEFMMAYGAADYWAKGSWKAQNGAVVLDTDGEAKPPFRLVKSAQTKGESVRLLVKSPAGRPVPNIDVVVKTAGAEQKARTDSEGVAEFPPLDRPTSATFVIRVYQFESKPFALNPEHDEFHFEIDGREITQVRFQDEKLAIERDVLILRHWGPDHPMRYAKQ
jgi:hypothetical protein